MDEERPKRRRRSRHRFSDMPDLTEVLLSKRSNVSSNEPPKGLPAAPCPDRIESLAIDHADQGRSANVSNGPETEDIPTPEIPWESHPITTDNEDPDITHFETSATMDNQESTVSLRISNWRVLWGLLRTNGSHKFTKIGYQSVRNLIDVISRNGGSSWRKDSADPPEELDKQITGLPHFSTLYKHYRPILMRELVPRSLDSLMHLDLSKAGARATSPLTEQIPKCQVRIIPPSEYARADVSTPPVWSQLKSTSLAAHEDKGRSFQEPSLSSEECVDIWPVIAAREWFYGPQTALHLQTEEDVPISHSFAEKGDAVTIALLHAPAASPERFQRFFGIDDTSLEYKTVRGTVVHCWTVHHPSRRGQPSFAVDCAAEMSCRDRQIVDKLSFASYTSPSDAVHVVVPEVPRTIEEDSEAGLNDDFSQENAKKTRVAPEVSEIMRKRRAA